MSEEKTSGTLNTSLIPLLLDDGSNWFDFDRRVEECLTIGGLRTTLQQSLEPHLRSKPVELADGASAEARGAYEADLSSWKTEEEAYTRALLLWEEKQCRATMAIQSRVGYLNFKKVEFIKRAYQMLDVLRAGRAAGAGKLIELTNRFYSIHLADCKDISDFAGQLSEANYELQALHSTVAFTPVQLVLRFLQGLGSNYEVFTSTFQQTHNLIEEPGKPAVELSTVVRKAYDEEDSPFP